jgi:hypothetical protein
MTDQDRFESRLAAALDRYADEAPARSSLDALVESATAPSQRRGLATRLAGGPARVPGFGATRPALGLAWLLLAVALLLALVAAVAVAGGLLRNDELSVVPSPVLAESAPVRPGPTRMPVATGSPEATVAPAWAVVPADQPRPGVEDHSWWRLAGNGSAFVALEDFNGWAPPRVWRSPDGVTWETVASPWPDTDSWVDQPHWMNLHAAGGEFLLGTGCEAEWQVFPPASEHRCPVWRSSNGVDWQEAGAAWDGRTEFQQLRFSTVDALLGVGPMDPMGLTGLVLEFDDDLAAIGFYRNHAKRLMALHSHDGSSWAPVDEVPPFMPIVADHASEWWNHWPCTVDIRDSTALAVLPLDDGPRGWLSDDGLSWEEIELDLPDDPTLKPDGRRGVCLSALGNGWAIAPGARDARATDVRVSSDGRHWTRLSVPDAYAAFEGRIRIAGDTLFLEPADGDGMVVGRIRF